MEILMYASQDFNLLRELRIVWHYFYFVYELMAGIAGQAAVDLSSGILVAT